MKKRIRSHIAYHSVLLTVLVLCLWMLSALSYNPQLQMSVVILGTFFYVGWALLHHFRHHDLTTQIVVEYILVGTLGITLVFLLIQ